MISISIAARRLYKLGIPLCLAAKTCLSRDHQVEIFQQRHFYNIQKKLFTAAKEVEALALFFRYIVKTHSLHLPFNPTDKCVKILYVSCCMLPGELTVKKKGHFEILSTSIHLTQLVKQ